MIQQFHCLIFAPQIDYVCSHKNLQSSVYWISIHNHQNLEANKVSFSKWMDKLWHIKIILLSTPRKSYKDMKSHGGNLSAYCQGKKLIWKVYMCMTPMIRSWKEQNCLDLRRTTYCQGWWCFQFIARVGWMNRQSSEEF